MSRGRLKVDQQFNRRDSDAFHSVTRSVTVSNPRHQLMAFIHNFQPLEILDHGLASVSVLIVFSWAGARV